MQTKSKGFLLMALIIVGWSAAVWPYAPDPYPSYPDTTKEEKSKTSDKPTPDDNQTAADQSTEEKEKGKPKEKDKPTEKKE